MLVTPTDDGTSSSGIPTSPLRSARSPVWPDGDGAGINAVNVNRPYQRLASRTDVGRSNVSIHRRSGGDAIPAALLAGQVEAADGLHVESPPIERGGGGAGGGGGNPVFLLTRADVERIAEAATTTEDEGGDAGASAKGPAGTAAQHRLAGTTAATFRAVPRGASGGGEYEDAWAFDSGSAYHGDAEDMDETTPAPAYLMPPQRASFYAQPLQLSRAQIDDAVAVGAGDGAPGSYSEAGEVLHLSRSTGGAGGGGSSGEYHAPGLALSGSNASETVTALHPDDNDDQAPYALGAEDHHHVGESLFIQPLGSADVLHRQRQLEGPKLVGQYVMGDIIGEGSYGKVREGFCSVTLRRVAVKILKQKRLRRIAGGEQNVQREIGLLQLLRHPNLIELYDVLYNEQKAKLYAIFEYCPVVLDDLLVRSPGHRLPPQQARRYFGHLIDGLEYLFSQGVVHRDIKPSNLLISRSGVLKIIDFGVALTLSPYERIDHCNTSAGTPAFQPPEIAAGEETSFWGSKVDIWAAGVTLYIMLAGEYPFRGENMYKLFENIASAVYVSAPGVSDDADALLMQLMSKDPQKRPTIPEIRRCKWMVVPLDSTVPEVPLLPYVPTPGSSQYAHATTTLLQYLRHVFPSAEPEAKPMEPSLDVSSSQSTADRSMSFDPNLMSRSQSREQAGGLRRIMSSLYSRIRGLGSQPEMS